MIARRWIKRTSVSAVQHGENKAICCVTERTGASLGQIVALFVMQCDWSTGSFAIQSLNLCTAMISYLSMGFCFV